MPQAKRSHHKVSGTRAKVPTALPLGKSVLQFCSDYGISRSTFEAWRRAGLGPAELQPIKGGRILITTEAETAWKAKHTALAAVAEATG
jgi:hypothetical protein